jgi:hypothetical protein
MADLVGHSCGVLVISGGDHEGKAQSPICLRSGTVLNRLSAASKAFVTRPLVSRSLLFPVGMSAITAPPLPDFAKYTHTTAMTVTCGDSQVIARPALLPDLQQPERSTRSTSRRKAK